MGDLRRKESVADAKQGLLGGAVSLAVSQEVGGSPASSGRWSRLGSLLASVGLNEKRKVKLRKIMDSTAMQTSMLVLLVYVLFVTDIAALAAAPHSTVSPIDASLLASVVLFGLEMVANAWVQQKRDAFYLTLELIGTLSILLEVSWVSAGLIPSNDYKTANVSRTAIITSRAGRVTRLVRLVRFVRALKIFMMIRRYFARKVESDTTEKSMAPSSIGSHLADKISTLVAFLVMVTMMVVMLLQTNEVDRAPQAYIETLQMRAGESKEELSPLVETLRTWVYKTRRCGNGGENIEG
eukprot:evm.model.scf_627.3 EVM.evm.TU.scf_627.3   scf_627:40476-44371(+)